MSMHVRRDGLPPSAGPAPQNARAPRASVRRHEGRDATWGLPRPGCTLSPGGGTASGLAPSSRRRPRCASSVSRRRRVRHLVLTGHGARCTWRRRLETAPRTLDGGQSPRHLTVTGGARPHPPTLGGQGDGGVLAVSLAHGAACGPNVARVGWYRLRQLAEALQPSRAADFRSGPRVGI
jgi:hypothetical protein